MNKVELKSGRRRMFDYSKLSEDMSSDYTVQKLNRPFGPLNLKSKSMPGTQRVRWKILHSIT